MADVPKIDGFDKGLLLARSSRFLFLAAFFGFRYFSTGTAIESIAVMPFVNESGNPDVEYLSNGMMDTLIKSLSQGWQIPYESLRDDPPIQGSAETESAGMKL